MMFRTTPPQTERAEDKVEASQQKPSTGAQPAQTQHTFISTDAAITGDLVSDGDISSSKALSKRRQYTSAATSTANSAPKKSSWPNQRR